jgi:hypothetical protein
MNGIKAFVGHSFEDDDKAVVQVFLDYFDTFKKLGFNWERAKDSELKAVSEKVKEKMEGRDLFIGILTRKNREIEHAKLNEKGKNLYCGNKNDFFWNASYWIIQESGYALGKGMQLLFLVEGGIPSLSGLQGDLEFISFSRENPQMAFQKINEMINSLLQKPAKLKLQEAVTEQKNIEQIKKEEELESTESKKDRKDWSDDDYINALIRAIFKDEEEEEKRIHEEYLKKKEGDERAKVKWESERLYWKHSLRKSDVFKDLKNLAVQNPNHPYPHVNLGLIYSDFENFGEASREYIKSAECSEDEDWKTKRICDAAKALAKNKNHSEAQELILKHISQRGEIICADVIFQSLGVIALEEGDVNSYTSFCEKTLTLKPDNYSLRFDLAYKYSEEEKHHLSLYHYKILIKQKQDGTYWNNLGVAYDRLGMKANAVRACNEAKKIKSTIAIGNLGKKLANEGFLVEAKNLLKEAVEIEDCDKNVYETLANIDKIKENEVKKEEELMSNLDQERKLKIDFAEAYVSPLSLESFPDKWKSKYGEINIEIKNCNFIGKGEDKVPEHSSLGLTLLTGLDPQTSGGLRRGLAPQQTYSRRLVEYKGKVTNRIVDYELIVKLFSSKDDTIPNEKKFSGYMIISKDFSKIRVQEKDKDGNIKSYDLTPI